MSARTALISSVNRAPHSDGPALTALSRNWRLRMADWTRGQLWDKVVEQAQKNPKYYEQLMADPRGLMEKQLGTPIPKSVNIKVLEEAPDTYYIVLPAFAKEGEELSDSDLEKVAGGGTV